MKAIDAVRDARAAGDRYQRVVNQFVDDFRRATPEERCRMIRDPIDNAGEIEGLLAAVVAAALGMATREITRPIKKLIVAGHVRKTGVKSNTRYYPTDPVTPASAERHAGNSSSRSASR